MRLWLLMFGGMLIWALHFGGVYLIASIFDLVSRSSAAASLWSITAWTLACVGANVALLVAVLAQWRQGGADPVRAFMLSVGALLAGVSLVSVVWQGLPALWFS